MAVVDPYAKKTTTVKVANDPLAKFGGKDAYIQSQLNKFNAGDTAMKGKITTDLARFGVNPVKPPQTADPLAKFGGKDAYIQSQLGKYTKGDAAMQGKITTDLARFGVNPATQGTTTETPVSQGVEDQPYSVTQDDRTKGFARVGDKVMIVNPDGTMREPSSQDDINYLGQLFSADTQRQQQQSALGFEQESNKAGFDYALQKLGEQQVMDTNRLQETQNRFGGLYSGGLQYQQGLMDKSYTEQRGQLAQDYNRRNQELSSKYGSSINEINQNIGALMQAQPGIIAERLQKAADEKAKLTGYYVPVGADELYNQLATLKQQAEQPGITAQARKALSQQADSVRSKLAGMGIDTSKLGAGSTAATAMGTPRGIATAETRQELERVRQFNEEMAYEKSRDAIKDKQLKREFEENARQFDLSYALDKLQEKNDKAYKDASLALQKDDNARQWAQETRLSSSGGSTGSGVKLQSASPNEVKQLLDNYKYEGTDKDGGKYRYIPGKVKGKEKAREKWVTDTVEGLKIAGYDNSTINQVMSRAGVSQEELMKLYESEE